MNRIDRHIGEQLRKLRAERQIDLAALANGLGLTPSALLELEAGHSRVRADQLWLLCRQLDVEVGYFFTGLDAALGSPSKHGSGQHKS